MEYLSVWWLVVAALELMVGRSNGDMAKLCSSRLPITSSTLSWNSVRMGEEGDLPPNVVTVGSGGPAWCRARQHAIWVSGAVVEGACRVPFLGSVSVAEDFEVLVSLNGSARLVEVPWDNLVAFPSGVVCTEDMMLALKKDPESGTVLPGFVDPNDRRAHLLRGTDTAIKSDEAILITEMEPTSYSLTKVRLGETNERHHDDVLEELEFRNDKDEPTKLIREETFEAQRVVYFGKMKGTVVGLPTSVSGPDIFPANITWGITNTQARNRSVTIEYEFPPRSSLLVRLIASIRNLEGGYSGILSSKYSDGEVLQRNVEGLHTERNIAEVRAEFELTTSEGAVEGTSTDFPKTIILLHSTTTTPPSVGFPDEENAISPSNSHNQVLPEPQGVGVSVAAYFEVSFLAFNVLLLPLLLQ